MHDPGAAESRDRPWVRRLRLHHALMRRGHISTSEAAQLIGADRRVARTDLEALAAHALPLHTAGEGHERRWVLDPGFTQVGQPIRLQDRLALLVGQDLVAGFLQDTDFSEALGRLTSQLAALDTSKTLDLDELRRRFHVIHEPEKDYGAHRDTLDTLVRAILACERVTFEYVHGRSGAQTSFPAVAPLSLVLYKRGVYVLFDKRGKHDLKAVERIVALERHVGHTFEYPRRGEYLPERVLSGRFGITRSAHAPEEVVLRFRPEVATYVRDRRWARDQRVEGHPDGGCTLRFVATGPELVTLVLGFGDKVHVDAPAWLRAAVVEELRGAIAGYGG